MPCAVPNACSTPLAALLLTSPAGFVTSQPSLADTRNATPGPRTIVSRPTSTLRNGKSRTQCDRTPALLWSGVKRDLMPASSTLTKVPAFDPRQSPTVLAHTTQPATRRAWASPTEPRTRRCLLPPGYRTQSPACGVCFLPLVPPTSTRLRTPPATADASLWARVLRPAPCQHASPHRRLLRCIPSRRTPWPRRSDSLLAGPKTATSSA